MIKPWIYLILAAGLEAAWTYSLRKLDMAQLKVALLENPLFSKAVGIEMGYLLTYLGLGLANIFFFPCR